MENMSKKSLSRNLKMKKPCKHFNVNLKQFSKRNTVYCPDCDETVKVRTVLQNILERQNVLCKKYGSLLDIGTRK